MKIRVLVVEGGGGEVRTPRSITPAQPIDSRMYVVI